MRTRGNVAAALITALATSIAFPASAEIRYQFSFSIDIPRNGLRADGTFEVLVRDPIIADTTLSPTDLISCTATFKGLPAQCVEQGFLYSLNPTYPAVLFGLAESGFPPELTPVWRFASYFEPSAFTTEGLHSPANLGFPTDGTSTLTVSYVPSVVPEPSPSMLLAIGLCAIVGARRATRRANGA